MSSHSTLTWKVPFHESLYPGIESSAGIATETINNLRDQWLTAFNWSKEQHEMNLFNHFTVKVEGQKIHYIHEKTSTPNAIPLLLLHGWPGSFLEFVPIIKPLTQEARTLSGKPISFHVIVPSLPGFAFSSPPPANWTTEDTARIYHTFMTEVLGFDKFAVLGTDWSAAPAYTLYANYTESVRALHAAFLPFLPPTMEQIAAENVSLTPLEQFEHARATEWAETGWDISLSSQQRHVLVPFSTSSMYIY